MDGTRSTVSARVQALARRLQQPAPARSRSLVHDLERRVAAIESRVAELRRNAAAAEDSSDDVLLTLDPVGYMDVAFELDLCECLLDEPHGRARGASVDAFLVPSLGLTVARRIFAKLLRLKSRISGDRASYDPPTIPEVLYFRSPAWLMPLVERLLPRGRPRRREDAPDGGVPSGGERPRPMS